MPVKNKCPRCGYSPPREAKKWWQMNDRQKEIFWETLPTNIIVLVFSAICYGVLFKIIL